MAARADDFTAGGEHQKFKTFLRYSVIQVPNLAITQRQQNPA